MANLNNFVICFVLLLLSIPCVAQDESTPAENRPASLFGVVTNSVTGEPLGHVRVKIYPNVGDVATVHNALSNADGHFAITNITPGTYVVAAERRGFNLAGGSDDEEHPPVRPTFKSGEEIRDFALRLVPDSVIAGRVVDSDGLPMEDVTVQAISNAPMQSIQTDDRGEFRIGGLQAGRYLVKAVVEAPPLPEIRTDGTPVINYGATYYPGSRSAKSAATVLVHAGQETSGIEIKLLVSSLLGISGRISSAPRVAKVNLQLHDGITQRTFFPQADGKFTIPRVLPGRYQLFGEYVTDTGVIFRSAPVDIHVAASSIEGVNLALMPMIELNGQARFEGDGKITGDEGSPSLDLEPLGLISEAEESDSIDDQGKFKLSELWPLRYHVLVQNLAKGIYVKSFRLNDREFPNGILDLRNGPAKGMLTVELAADGAEISGTVRDEKGAATRSKIALFFDDEFGSVQAGETTAHPDGTYTFSGVAPGKYKILAYHPSRTGAVWTDDVLALYSSVLEKIEVRTGDKVSQDLKVLSTP
jgi:hypothetical protein